ncbi:MAG: FAD-binding protein, partial [Bacteroides sp.]|nr:FAD-binding protein [Bacteroides sp.]
MTQILTEREKSVLFLLAQGLKNEENFNKLRKFANLIGAALAGSRGAVDMGLIDKEHQIGQTGKTVAP